MILQHASSYHGSAARPVLRSSDLTVAVWELQYLVGVQCCRFSHRILAYHVGAGSEEHYGSSDFVDFLSGVCRTLGMLFVGHIYPTSFELAGDHQPELLCDVVEVF